MPGFDNTGPFGKGPLTGKRRGRCRGAQRMKNEQRNQDEDRIKFGRGRRNDGQKPGRNGQNECGGEWGN